ncbi:outer membrane beta-barrel protein, partial [Acidisphaera rubrifaciens]|uniref:outer membrane beta-barrel protein n=1 Tax=Acidisphaera rubrifaciens TaxID=50715 RepID=UPI0011DC7293
AVAGAGGEGGAVRRRVALCGTLSAALAATPGLAAADDLSAYFPASLPGYGVERGVTVVSRLRPGYDALGLRVGDMLDAQPALEQSIGFDSNPAPGVTGIRPSLVEITHPSLSLSSEDDRIHLGAYVDLTDTRYLEDPSVDTTDYTVATGAVIEIGPGHLTVGLAHLMLHQARTDLGALPSDAPIAFVVDDARAAYTLPDGPLTVKVDTDLQHYRFDATTIEGIPVPQAYRDRVVAQGGVTLRYDLADLRSAIVVLRGADTAYQNNAPLQPTRDSQGATLLAGLDYDDDGVWHWRVLLGVAARHYDAGVYGNHVAPVAEADLIWNPDGMETVTGRLSRTIEDAAQEGVSGYTWTQASLVWDHEYLRNLLLQVRVGFQWVAFLQGGGDQYAETAGLGATWLVSRYVHVTLTYDHTSQQGGRSAFLGTVGSYGRDVGLLSARLAL